MANILTVYYSKKGENYFGGKIKSISKGNTEIVAEIVQKAVGGDIFEVDREIPYPDNYNKYDTIFVGYPSWCGTMPMVLFTFLEHYDLKGKKIIPFCTNEGSGMGSSLKDIKKLCPGAKVEQGLAIHGGSVGKAEKDIKKWI